MEVLILSASAALDPILENDVTLFISLVCSVVAVIISICAQITARRSIVTQTISTQRIEWIGTVRNLINSFLKEYSGLRSKKELINIYTEISLYLNPKHDCYGELADALKNCIEYDGYVEKFHWDVVRESQRVLDEVWVRMKREAGISRREEKSLTRKLTRDGKNNSNSEWSSSL